ncbi:MAG: ATP-binding protein [Bacteroidia bacterium]|nr:ATP-binding protein [Bacteroidia bacterium]
MHKRVPLWGSLVLALVVPAVLAAQEKAALDSLWRLTRTPARTQQTRAFNELAYHYTLFDLDSARVLRQRALALALPDNNLYELGFGCFVEAIIVSYEGDFAASDSLNQVALTYAYRAEAPQLVAQVLNNIGVDYRYQGAFGKAIEYISRSRAIYDSLGPPYWAKLAQAYGNLADVYLQLGAYPEALDATTRAAELARQADAKPILAQSLYLYGDLYSVMGRYPEAEAYYREAVAAFERLNDRYTAASALGDWGELYLKTDNWRAADSTLILALEWLHATGSVTNTGPVLIALAKLRRHEQRYADAQRFLDQGFRLTETTTIPEDHAALLLEQSWLFLARQQPGRAQTVLAQAARLSDSLGLREVTQEVLMLQAQLAAGRGDYREAYTLEVRFRQLSDSLGLAKTQERLTQLELAQQSERRSQELTEMTRSQHEAAVRFRYQLALLALVLLSGGGFAFWYQRSRHRRARHAWLEAHTATLEAEVKAQTQVLESQKAALEQLNATLTQLTEIGQAIVSNLTVPGIVRTVHTKLAELLPLEAFGVGVYEPKEHALVFEGVFELGQTLPTLSLPLSQTDKLATRCFLDEKPILQATAPENYLVVTGAIMQSVMYVPVRNPKGKGLLGVLSVQHRLPDRYQPRHIELLESLAVYVGTALENARVLQTVALQKEEIQAQSEEIYQTNEELEATLRHLKETQSQLVHTEKMSSLGQLTAGIAHEINNPINFVWNNVGALRRDLEVLLGALATAQSLLVRHAPPEVLADYQAQTQPLDLETTIEDTRLLLEGIATGAQRTAEIVRGLRSFSRLDENVFKPAHLEEALDSAVLLAGHLMDHRHTVARDYQSLPPIDCYPGQLNQVFLNLVTNAVQAMPQGGQLRVATRQETRPEGPWAVVTVGDTGEGIAPEVLGRIFEPFYTTKEVGKGTGLGLSISYSIVERHGGHFEVQSTLGKGATFEVWLPYLPRG